MKANFAALPESFGIEHTVEIIVNGQPRRIESGTTVAALLEHLNLEPQRVAVEVNLDLVPRVRHAETALADGDCLEVVTLVGGG